MKKESSIMSIPAANFDIKQQITCTPTQAMAALGLGKTAIYALLSDNSLRSIKHGKSRLIIVASLFEWVSSLESYQFGN
jgi:excisionase family DNA binding protein